MDAGKQIKIEYRAVDSLIDYIRNPRKNDDVVDRIVASINAFGFTVPVLIKSDGTIIDGHLRLKGARKLGMAEVPVIVCDDWSEASCRAFRLLANKSASWAKWDFELLALEFEELRDDFGLDLSLTGFEAYEIDPLLAAEWEPPAEENESAPEAAPEPAAPDMRKIMFTCDQHELIMLAVDKIRTAEGDPNISEGRCVELMAGDFLSSCAADEAE